jgi:hypothetical protein
MTRQFFRSKKKLLIALAVIIVCLVSLCYTFFPRSVTGLQIIPELSDATSAQILHPDWTASHGIVLEGDALNEFLTMLSSAEYTRTLYTGSNMVGKVYHIYGYESYSDDSPTTLLFSLYLSDQGILYLNNDKLFCYTVPDAVLDFFLSL